LDCVGEPVGVLAGGLWRRQRWLFCIGCFCGIVILAVGIEKGIGWIRTKRRKRKKTRSNQLEMTCGTTKIGRGLRVLQFALTVTILCCEVRIGRLIVRTIPPNQLSDGISWTAGGCLINWRWEYRPRAPP
jgi:hypothetical protein